LEKGGYIRGEVGIGGDSNGVWHGRMGLVSREEGEGRGVVGPVLSQVKGDDSSEGENGEAKERASGEKLRIHFQFHVFGLWVTWKYWSLGWWN
jgi:hypothetical protein